MLKVALDIQMNRTQSPHMTTTKKTLLGEITTKTKLPLLAITN